MDVDRL